MSNGEVSRRSSATRDARSGTGTALPRPGTRAPRALALRPRLSARQRLFGGGVHGNGRLTVLTGLILIVLLAPLGLTIVRIGQLLWLHLFLGLVLLGPVVLKLASTGYRFVRYYTHNTAYRHKGPPPPVLRGLGPLIVPFTLGVFATGVVLLFVGRNGPAEGNLLLLHKVTFIGWIAVTAIHVLGHLPEVLHLFGGSRRTRREMKALRTAMDSRFGEMLFAVPDSGAEAGGMGAGGSARLAGGDAGRAIAVVVASLGGVGIAIMLLGQFAGWTH